MNNDAILILGDDEICENTPETTPQQYLTIEGALKEIADQGKQALALTNLGAYSRNKINQLLANVNEKIDQIEADSNTQSESILSELSLIQKELTKCIKEDNNTSAVFNSAPKILSRPDTQNTVATVGDILDSLQSYQTKAQTEQSIDEKLLILDKYALLSDVYKKSNTYCKAKIDSMLKDYLKKDGSVKMDYDYYPEYASSIANKEYVDKVMRTHKREHPHNFQDIVNKALAQYYTKQEVYNKAQTYSRLQIDQIIDSLVDDACKSLIQRHINTVQHLTSAEVQQIIKRYATLNLVTKDNIDEFIENAKEEINDAKPVWKTSGPVLTTVGFVEDNTELPKEMSMQEIFDAIFYGSKISIHANPSVQIGEVTDITVCVYGGTSIDSAILYQGDKVLKEFAPDDFEEGCITIPSNPISEDTEFRFDVTYANGMEVSEAIKVKIVLPAFVGILPKWKSGNTITMDYLKELSETDPINNTLLTEYSSSIKHSYDFMERELYHLMIVVPTTFNNLRGITTSSQSFGIDAFEVIDAIPLYIKEINKNITYKVYIYKQALSRLNQEVTFNFVEK